MHNRGKKSWLDTDELNAFFEALDHLDQVELLRMRAAWQAVGRLVHEEDWAEVRAIGARDGLSKEADEMRERAAAWARRGDDGVPYALGDNSLWAQLKMEAEGAIVDVALGTALGDRLDEQTRATLLAAWEGGAAATSS